MIIIHLIIGALAVAVLFALLDYAHKRNLGVRWWQWILTALGIIYGVFVLEVIVGFLVEDAPQAALVMGILTGIVAVIWGILLGRFVFAPSGKSKEKTQETANETR